MENTKKVIILERMNSKVFSQAIFILRDNSSEEFSALEEAERIVENYLMYTHREKKSKIPLIILGVCFFVVFTSLYIAFL